MADSSREQSVLCQIANSACGVVSRLLDRDQLLAESLRSETTSSRQIFREECITVDMVSTLREKFPDNIDITLFTPPEEVKNGADWYWRVQKSENAIHARVQAKRIQRSVFGQSDSLGTVEIDREQLSRLIDSAELDQKQLPGLQAWLATYARYDASPPCGRMPSACGRHNCNNSCAGWGVPSVWVAQAEEIDLTDRQRTVFSIKDIVATSVRLDCILPCTSNFGTEGPAAKHFTLSSNLLPYDRCVEIIQSNVIMRNSFAGAMQIKLP